MVGAAPLVANPRSHKATRIAMEELAAGQLEYDLPDGNSGAGESKRGKE